MALSEKAVVVKTKGQILFRIQPPWFSGRAENGPLMGSSEAWPPQFAGRVHGWNGNLTVYLDIHFYDKNLRVSHVSGSISQ